VQTLEQQAAEQFAAGALELAARLFVGEGLHRLGGLGACCRRIFAT
jgi:hypothetical protein